MIGHIERLAGCVVFSLLAIQGTMGQESITPLYGNPAATDYYGDKKAVWKAATADTLQLPLFDDFSTSFVAPDARFWSDSSVFVNNNYGIDPVTNGVATLDALDFDGSIYPNASFDPSGFVADRLTSHPFSLDLVPSDSLHLSFLYQPGGRGDMPETQDSLLVDFYAPGDSAWVNVWGIPGRDTAPFRHVVIPVTQPRFLSEGFRFRFRNRASLPRNNDFPDKRDNVDHWHIDYVRLDSGRFAADTILRDVAFNAPLTSVLEDLTALPWSHFEAAFTTILDPTVPARYRNNDTIARNITRSLVIEEPWYNESYIPGPPTTQDIPPGEDTVVEFGYIYPVEFDRGESALIRFKASLRTDDFDPKQNDTVIHDQVFRDYYAYDDGTPEAGYGLRGQGTRNGYVAVAYRSYEQDLLGGVDILFNQLYDSVNLDYYFQLQVWDEEDGRPGSLLLEDGNDHTPVYSETFPGFIRYRFSTPVEVDGPFFVGWRQYNEFMLNVGLDLNNRPDPHVMYYNYQGTWEVSGAPGVIMLRPFLYNETAGFRPRQPVTGTFTLYPNPASGSEVRLNMPADSPVEGMNLEVFDASGRLVLRQRMESPILRVSMLGPGIYYLKLQGDAAPLFSKMIINR